MEDFTMSRINTNVSAYIANVNLSRSQATEAQSIERLSSGLKINSGADDPAGLIISQQLSSEVAGVNQALDNSQQAQNVISTADAALGEVSNLLVSIKALAVQSANTGALSSDEIEANQLQVDSAIASITRISNSTSFGGLKLLDGSLGYLTSGVSTSALHDVQITSASLNQQKSIEVNVNVVASAQQAKLDFATSAVGTSVSLQVSGSTGTQVLSFVSGTKSSAIAYAINQVSDSTGVTASLINSAHAASGIILTATDYGSKNFVSVTTVGSSGAFNTTNSAGGEAQRTVGKDAVATVNGNAATADGLNLSLNTASLSLSLSLDKAFGTGTESFAITGGGATFQLGGQVLSNQQTSLAIGSVAASSLGSYQGGYLSDITTGGSASLVSGNAAKASSIIDDAITQVSDIRGRLGAFEANTLNTNIDSLQVASENLSSSLSNIQDTDFAQETSNLTRSQILVQAGTSVLSTANNNPQNVLKLLSGS
jgi:flagellin